MSTENQAALMGSQDVIAGSVWIKKEIDGRSADDMDDLDAEVSVDGKRCTSDAQPEQQHMRNQGESGKRLVCDTCSKIFRSLSVYKRHLMFHKGPKVFTCEHCAFSCKRKFDLRSHVLTHIEVISFTCLLCNFDCNSKIKLMKHIAQHIAAKRLVKKTSRTRIHSKRKDPLYQPEDSNILKIRPRTYLLRRNGLPIEKFDFSTPSDFPLNGSETDLGSIIKNESSSEREHETILFDPTIESFFSVAMNNALHCKLCQFSCPGIDQMSDHFRTSHPDVQLPQCEECGFLCLSDAQLAMHSKKHSQSGEEKIGQFDCEKCSFSSKTSAELKCHRFVHLNMQPFSCPSCPYTSMRKSQIDKHLLVHTNLKSLSCCLCNYKCRKMWLLFQHMNRHSTEKKHLQQNHNEKRQLACKLCSFTCWSQYGLKKHMWTHTGRKLHECAECDYKCQWLSSFQQHMLIHNKDKPYKCSICSYACRTKPYLKKHLEAHDEDNRQRCQTFTETGESMPVNSRESEGIVVSRTVANILDMLKRKGFPVEQYQRQMYLRGPKQFRCALCPYVCKRLSSLMRHVYCHNTESPFKCDHCDYAGKSKEYLRKHMKCHSGAEPITCKLCSYSTYFIGNMTKHLIIHTDIKAYKCQYCSYSGRKKCALDKHVLIHSSVKPFLCSQCGGTFRSNSKLREHMWIHMEKKITCAHCSFRCRRQAELDKHMLKKHSGNEGKSMRDPKEPKSFACLVCGFSSRNYSALRCHMDTHAVVQPALACPRCSFRSSSSSQLVSHLKKHSDDGGSLSCQFCPFVCKKESTLRFHHLRHIYLDPFQCQLCEYTSFVDSDLERHMQSKHKSAKVQTDSESVSK